MVNAKKYLAKKKEMGRGFVGFITSFASMNTTPSYSKRVKSMKKNKELYGLVCMMIEHYELPLYHPAFHHDIKRKLLQYAHREGLLEFVQGYVDRAKTTLEDLL